MELLRETRGRPVGAITKYWRSCPPRKFLSCDSHRYRSTTTRTIRTHTTRDVYYYYYYYCLSSICVQTKLRADFRFRARLGYQFREPSPLASAFAIVDPPAVSHSENIVLGSPPSWSAYFKGESIDRPPPTFRRMYVMPREDSPHETGNPKYSSSC